MNRGKRGTVLVTGATDFVAGHCIVDLLAHGYDVREGAQARGRANRPGR